MDHFISVPPVRRARAAWVSLTNGAYLMIGDVIALALALAAAAGTSWFVSETLLGRPYFYSFMAGLPDRLLVFSGLGIGFMFWVAHKNHYRSRLPMWKELQEIAVAIAMLAVIDGFIQYAVKHDFSRLWLTQTWIFAAFFVGFGRVFIKRGLMAAGTWRVPTVVLGSGEWVANAARALAAERHLGYSVVETVSRGNIVEQDDIQTWSQQTCSQWPGHFFVLAPSPDDVISTQEIAAEFTRSGVPFAIIPPLKWVAISTLEPQQFFSHDVLMLVPRDNLSRPFSATIKRSFDFLAALFLIIIGSPVLLLTALAIFFEDGKPIFYGSKRIGRNGEVFLAWKFRSMVVDAEARLEKMLAADKNFQNEWQSGFKLENDPRRTKVGRYIRSRSLDELPQLLNVLKGEMSLVGPRPILPDEVQTYCNEEIGTYMAVRPGITGLWQVSGRNHLPYQDRIRMNSWYVRNWTMWLDVTILIRTILVVARKVGAR